MSGHVDARNMGDDTTIRLSKETVDELFELKQRGDSYEDVIQRLLEERSNQGGENEASTPEPERNKSEATQAPQNAADASADLDALLSGWRPGRTAEEREERLEAARAALEWLRDRDVPASGRDVKEALYEAHAPDEQGEETFWKKTARPAFQLAEEAGAVKYREGHHDYQWVGESDE